MWLEICGKFKNIISITFSSNISIIKYIINFYNIFMKEKIFLIAFN